MFERHSKRAIPWLVHPIDRIYITAAPPNNKVFVHMLYQNIEKSVCVFALILQTLCILA